MKFFLELFLIKYDLKGRIFQILTYPFLSIYWNTIVFMKSSMSIIKSLIKNDKVSMFDENCALNYHWYDTLAYNLKNHGRFGYSKTTINKKFLVGNWFHISKISIYPFWKSNVLLVFISWIMIPIFFCLLFPRTPFYWLTLVSF